MGFLLSQPSRLCGGPDHVDHEFGFGKHRDMTARDFMNAGFHSLGHETLETKTILGLSAIFTFLFVAGALVAGRSAISSYSVSNGIKRSTSTK